jgi:hypothetical protein
MKIRRYMINDLGISWIYEAINEKEASLKYIDDVCGAKTIAEYEKYCIDVGVPPQLELVDVTDIECFK